ncbi:pirin family protein [Pasteurella testudinis]|uniref:pirin family protein n=1 Tax=Pasteurella testudinis TaxID=761 RepID=UPI0040585F76
MIERRPFHQLGAADHGWLNAKHHFSFAEYYDPSRMRWGNLRVWNDDTIAPQSGFPTHPHKAMEIITYVRRGAISHKDSLGNSGRTVAGDVQVMSAGSGIYHSEYNLEHDTTQIFQIWILPTHDNAADNPAWGTQPFPKSGRDGRFVTLASGFAADLESGNSLPIRTDARVVGATIQAGDTLEYRFGHAERYGYLVPAQGTVEINGVRIEAGDGAAIHGESLIRMTALADAEVVLVESE